MKSINKELRAVCYCRLSNIQQTLNPDCIIYLYSKDKDALDRQEQQLKDYCKGWLLNPKKVYKDLGGPNFLSNKSDLVRMLFENSNTDILILSADRLSRNIKDLFDIGMLCNEKNIRFFDISSNNYVFEDQLKIYKNKDHDYGL